MFHLIAPTLVTADVVIADLHDIDFRSVLAACYAWPLMYLVALFAVTATGAIKVPYPFLDPGQIGWLGVCGTLSALALLISVIATLLWSLNHLWRAWRNP
jgi:hypothetical protein